MDCVEETGVPDVLVDIVKSFHSNMVARIRLDGELLEEVGMSNGLRQSCTTAPTRSNFYACVVAERWMEKVQGSDSVGTRLMYKLDQQHFRRSTRGASEVLVHKGEFADDDVLLASSRQAAEAAIRTYVSVTQSFGLTVSVQKTKFVVVDCGVEEDDTLHMALGESSIEHVSEFPYLGSLIAENGRSHVEVDKRIASASKAFGALRRAVFKDSHLLLTTKSCVYRACVPSVLLCIW